MQHSLNETVYPVSTQSNGLLRDLLQQGQSTLPGFGGAAEDLPSRVERLQETLHRKLGPEYLSFRPGGGGTKLTYIEGWKVIELANEFFGYYGWSHEVKSYTVDFIDEVKTDSTGAIRYNIGVSATVRVTIIEGTFHEDMGYGKIDNVKSKGDGLDKCRKEAVTDALKRAVRYFGNLLGNCVYDKAFAGGVQHMSSVKPKFDPKLLHRADSVAPVKLENQNTKLPTAVKQELQNTQIPPSTDIKPIVKPSLKPILKNPPTKPPEKPSSINSQQDNVIFEGVDESFFEVAASQEDAIMDNSGFAETLSDPVRDSTKGIGQVKAQWDQRNKELSSITGGISSPSHFIDSSTSTVPKSAPPRRPVPHPQLRPPTIPSSRLPDRAPPQTVQAGALPSLSIGSNVNRPTFGAISHPRVPKRSLEPGDPGSNEFKRSR